MSKKIKMLGCSPVLIFVRTVESLSTILQLARRGGSHTCTVQYNSSFTNFIT